MTGLHNGSKKGFRPTLTAAHIEHILKLAKTEQPLSNDSISLISKLAPFQAKIHNAGLVAATLNVSNASSAETLASAAPTPTATAAKPAFQAEDTGGFTREQKWEFCYNKYKSHPELCSLEEIEGAQEHRYLNDLMSLEEESAFEAGVREVIQTKHNL